MTIGSLFSGIGGLERGLELAGLGPTLFQVEREPFRRDVLAMHWPTVLRFHDVCAVGAHSLPAVDVLCGGFPCQDLSTANSAGRRGLKGDRSGLWREFARIIGECRPRFVVVENVRTWRDWVPVVRGDLWRLGYPSVSVSLCASDVGAPHRRERVFVIAADADRDGQSTLRLHAQMAKLPEIARSCRQEWGDAPSGALGVADGIPRRMDRLRAVGNAVVPAIGRVVGRFILELERARQGAI